MMILCGSMLNEYSRHKGTDVVWFLRQSQRDRWADRGEVWQEYYFMSTGLSPSWWEFWSWCPWRWLSSHGDALSAHLTVQSSTVKVVNFRSGVCDWSSRLFSVLHSPYLDPSSKNKACLIKHEPSAQVITSTVSQPAHTSTPELSEAGCMALL